MRSESKHPESRRHKNRPNENESNNNKTITSHNFHCFHKPINNHPIQFLFLQHFADLAENSEDPVQTNSVNKRNKQSEHIIYIVLINVIIQKGSYNTSKWSLPVETEADCKDEFSNLI
jgi:hypothetical protein